MNALGHSTRRRLLDQAVVDVIAAQRLHDAATSMLGDSRAGHPKAARYDDTGRAANLWCFTHQRDHVACEHDGLSCGGTPVTGASDPTGEAAMGPDRAALALALIDRMVPRLATVAAVLANELTAWSPMTGGIDRTDPSSVTAPDGWCTSCWRDDRRHTPIGTRPGGTAPYYARFCEWCGRYQTVHKQPPPLKTLREHWDRHSTR